MHMPRSGLPRRRRRALVLLLLPLTVSCALVGASEDEMRHPEDRSPVATLGDHAQRQIQAATLEQHIEFLRSVNGRQGAGAASRVDRAAAWLASRLHLAGLAPAGDDGGFIHYRPADPHTTRVPTVMALRPGADPARADEYVIILARFGHGEPPAAHAAAGAAAAQAAADGAAAVDAAVAAAVLIEVAGALAGLPARLPRPVLFMVVTGEDGGWEGAGAIAGSPTVALSSAAAVLVVGPPVGPPMGQAWGPPQRRADGQAAPDDLPVLAVGGHGYSSLGPLLDEVVVEHPALGLRVESAVPASELAFRTGAMAPFAGLGIPGLLIWAHAAAPAAEPGRDGGESDAELATRLARLVFLATHRVASSHEPPDWTDAGLRAVGAR
jgi:hypothetical protein